MRHRIDEADRRTNILTFRVNDAERRSIERNAQAQGVTVSELARQAMVNATATVDGKPAVK